MTEREIERERLLKILDKTIAIKDEDTDDYIDWLADELLNNSVIPLPCKVGDMVYVITEQGIRKIEVESIHCWSSGVWKCNGWCGTEKYRVGYEFSFDDFGKTVFFTIEEAEKMLERKKKNE